MESDMPRVWLTNELSAEILKSAKFHENSPEIVKDIVGGKCTVIDLIERLAEALTNKDSNCRAHGTLLLSKVLSGLSATYLDHDQLTVIVNFYTDRLKDHHNVIPAVVTGLVAISNMSNLTNEAAARIIMALFKEVPCQQQVRQDRYNIYVLINNLLCNRPRDLISLGPDFVYGVISAIDGERDPRNLLLLFTMLPHLLKSIPLIHLVEEMFEVMSCYFPVDFNVSAKDPSAVTREDLSSKLCLCLCAITAFDEHCIPLALEKLDTNLRLAKIDSLKLLIESTKVFPVTSYEPYLVQIWALLQNEYSNKMDSELRKCASDTLAALLILLSKEQEQRNIFEGFLQRILISMEAVLVDATAVPIFGIPAAVYITCANATRDSCALISESVFNSLIRFYTVSDDETLKVAALQCIIQVFQAVTEWNILHTIKYDFRHLCQACLSACRTSNEHLRLAGFATISVVAEVMAQEHLQQIYDIIANSVDGENSQAVTEASRRCLLSLSYFHPDDVSTLMKVKLSDVILPHGDILEKRLMALCILILNNKLSFDIMEFVTKLIQHSQETALTVFKTLKTIFEDKLMNLEMIVDIEKKYNLVALMLEWLFANPNDFSDNRSFRSGFVNLIVRNLSANAQTELLKKHSSSLIRVLDGQSAEAVTPLNALLVSLRAEVSVDNLHKIVGYLCAVALSDGNNHTTQEKACTLLANILNKAHKREKSRENFNELCFIVDSATNDLNLNERGLTLLIWFTKGMVLCGYSRTDELIIKLATLLDDDTLGLNAAKGFKIILQESEDDLTTLCHCTINYLYKQRVFETFAKFTLTKEKDAMNGFQRKEAYLLAWAYVCQSIAKSLFKRISQLHSIIVESLNGMNVDLLLTTLATASYLVTNKDIQFAGSLQTVIPRLIELSHFKQSMNVRIKSLEVLFELAENYNSMLLLPYKQNIIYEGIITQLDDHKRLVRSAAVKAKARWFLVGAPGEEK